MFQKLTSSSYALGHLFSNFIKHQHHLEGLLKGALLDPPPRVPEFHKVLGGAHDFTFLTVDADAVGSWISALMIPMNYHKILEKC